jgi:hypothetical protein
MAEPEMIILVNSKTEVQECPKFLRITLTYIKKEYLMPVLGVSVLQLVYISLWHKYIPVDGAGPATITC